MGAAALQAQVGVAPDSRQVCARAAGGPWGHPAPQQTHWGLHSTLTCPRTRLCAKGLTQYPKEPALTTQHSRAAWYRPRHSSVHLSPRRGIGMGSPSWPHLRVGTGCVPSLEPGHGGEVCQGPTRWGDWGAVAMRCSGT